MRFSIRTLLSSAWWLKLTTFTFMRLNRTDAALLIIDHQLGLSALVHDYSPIAFRSAIHAHPAIGSLFSLPKILTRSADLGPKGHLPKEVIAMHPNTLFIHRRKEQLIIGGIVTEVCTAFLALSLIEAGFEVFANTDASGTTDTGLASDANRRKEIAGVTLMGMFGVVMVLMRDWRHTPGLPEVLPFLDVYMPEYSLVARSYGNAIENGSLCRGSRVCCEGGRCRAGRDDEQERKEKQRENMEAEVVRGENEKSMLVQGPGTHFRSG